VFLLVLALLVFELLAPDADWARAVGFALAAAALTAVVGTSRARSPVRRQRALWVGVIALLVVLAIATGVLSEGVTDVLSALVAISIPVALVGGLLRLIRASGVTPQVVAGALAIYLLVGLLFASLIGFVSRVESGPYFRQANEVTNGVRVYYSFTVLTTTGFGDYTPITSLGHAIAVLEMLTGQLYLVTVIGILVGNFAGRQT
ncbi:MAG: two pore domain potassium channel family protein, partial [Solirubrobacterales bacterium]|nr:two pore domain potassium channel family protein [Solirubrobacterales bacterium]